MDSTTPPSSLSLPLRYLLGIILILAISLLIFFLVMQPPAGDVGLMAGFLSITAVISALAGYGSYRMGWVHRSPTIRWTLLGGYALSSVNVWVTARLMFTNLHDLLLATVLLLFAGGIAMALGYFLSSALTDRIRGLDQAARSIANGNLEVRIPVLGRDEMAVLADTFNQMAIQLQATAQKKKELETLRRDLIAWAGHDLHTPLASIRAIVEALADGVVDDPETVQRYLHTALRDIQALSVLIDDLFQMSQIDAGGLQLDLEYNSLSDLISDTLESFSELALRKGVVLKGSVDAGIDPVYMDAQRIGRVLNNLIRNALRHTPEGGEVHLRALPTDPGVLIEVSDTGEGIPAEDIPHIFERFYRGERSRNRATGGAGLGLAIARGIVEAHHGTIDVESLPQQTRFYFTLPGSHTKRE
jgi:signal transduction histidine kinase